MDRHILVVDDDAFAMVAFFSKIRSALGAEYRIATCINEGLEQIHCGTQWTAAVFDLLLPVSGLPRTIVSREELDASVDKLGGILLASVFQHRFPGRPMAVWSMAQPPVELAPFVERGVCRFFAKMFLSKEINDLVQFVGQEPESPRVASDIWDSVLLQPNLAGLGIDLKVFLERLSRTFG